jgi:hypothetical protein
MGATKPVQGGVSAVLQMLAILMVAGAFFGGMALNLSAPQEFVAISSALIVASVLWAIGVIVQQLRNIEFNTRAYLTEPEQATGNEVRA